MQLPALAIQQPDLGRTLAQIAAIKGQGLQNKLLESQIAREGQLSGLRSKMLGGDNTYNALAAGGGPTNEAAAMMGNAPSGGINNDLMKRYLALDPKGGAAIMDALNKMDTQQREKFKETSGMAAKLGLWVESAGSPQEKQMRYVRALAQARQMGIPVQGTPQAYDPSFVHRQIALGMALNEPAPPSGFQRTAEGLEPMKGGPADLNYKRRESMATRGAQTDLGKITEDVAAGRMSPEDGAQERLRLLRKKRDELGKTEFTNANALRDEYNKLSGDFIKVRDAYHRVVASGKNPSPAGDMAMIFNYMKVLDPGSVVRESEFATAASTGAFGERMKAAVNKVLNGERLSATQRNDFMNRAEKLYDEQAKLQTSTKKEYTRLAKQFGVKPENVIVDFQGEPGGLPPVKSRVVGKTYETPRGPAVWREGGWELK